MSQTTAQARTVIMINGDGMGQASPELRHKLIKTYLGLLDLEDRLPAGIFFYAEGIKLVLDGSPVLPELEALAAKGVHLGVCGTCINHFDVGNLVRVGTVGTMKDLVEAQWSATKVITL
jgi:hypothetical protein